jgi:hypothetical protein
MDFSILKINSMHGSTVSDCIEHYKTCLKDFLLRLGFIHTTIVELSVVYLFKNIRHFFIFLDRDIRKMKQVANIMRHPLRMSCKTFSLLVLDNRSNFKYVNVIKQMNVVLQINVILYLMVVYQLIIIYQLKMV